MLRDRVPMHCPGGCDGRHGARTCAKPALMAGPILILKTGETLPELKARRGDFEAWFEVHLRAGGCPVRTIDAHRAAPLPPPAGLAGVLVTGSPKSVYEDDPWIAEAAAWTRQAAEAGVPVLGVCFGHQLLAHAFGGRVSKNPAGREAGTVTVELTAAGRTDPLFEGLPETLAVHQSHQDAVLEAPAGATVLAENAHTPVQALAIGAHVRTVQFHPEFDADIARGYVEGRADRIRAEARARGEDPEQALARLRASVRESDHGRRILANWLRHFVA